MASSKQEKKKFWVRVLCIALSFLMVLSIIAALLDMVI